MRFRLLPSAALAMLALGAAVPHAARASAITGLEVMTSTVFQQNQSSFSGIAARMRMKSVLLIPEIDFLPTIEYWRNHTSVESFGLESTRRDATMGVSARYTFRHEGWSPYGGVGFGVHFISNEVNAPQLGLVNQEHSVILGSPSLLGGVAFPIQSSVGSFIDVQYHVLSGQDQMKINWGLGFKFK